MSKKISKTNKFNDTSVNTNSDMNDEIVYDENQEITGKDLDKSIKKLKEQLKNCKSERQDFLDGWQRSKADYVNLKRRNEEEKRNIREYGTENLLLEFITVVDNFEMAFKDEATWNLAPENWRIGIKHIYNQIVKILEENGVKQDDPFNQSFDPNIHHSVEIVIVSNKDDDGKIIKVQQKGYLLKDKVIRPATVIVGKYND